MSRFQDPRSFTVEYANDSDIPDFCPQGCGGLTEDPYGGPCQRCWDVLTVGRWPVDDDEEDPDCSHGCGRRASNQWGTCGPCEREVTGRDEDGDEEQAGGDEQ